MIDSHCHLDVAAFDADRDAVLARAGAAGVHALLVPAIRPSTWDALVSWAAAPAAAAAGVRVALGIHPQVVPDLTPAETARLADLPAALTAARAIAVGECGLDGAT
ncbi:MAG: TatD family hydrolase, partial [Deltaproteobacteria bacterium]|nr:TatD family hydrolase [Deltaproteobacteria bacterium]